MTGGILDVVLLGPAAIQYGDGLRTELSASMRFTSLDGSVIDLRGADALRGAEVLVSRIFPAGHPMPRLALLQVPAAGVETIDVAAVPPGIAICNTFGHEQAIAEYVIHGAIGILRGLRKEEASFRRGPESLQDLHGRTLAREFSGCRVGIIGLGHIGLAVERLCNAFGCETRVCSRHEPSCEPGSSRWYSPGDLDDFFDGLDVVVVACALTPDTLGMVERRHLDAMHRGVLVNVARAEIVVEDDLVDALSSGVLQGAVLDVWGSAWTPRRFDAFCNVMMTPHVSAWTAPMRQRRLAQILGNLVAQRDGLPLANLVRAA